MSDILERERDTERERERGSEKERERERESRREIKRVRERESRVSEREKRERDRDRDRDRERPKEETPKTKQGNHCQNDKTTSLWTEADTEIQKINKTDTDTQEIDTSSLTESLVVSIPEKRWEKG